MTQKLSNVREAQEALDKLQYSCEWNANELLGQHLKDTQEYGFIKTIRQALTDLDKVIEEDNKKTMRHMGMLNVLCECHLEASEETQDMIIQAVSANLPDGWSIKKTVDRLELEPPSQGEG